MKIDFNKLEEEGKELFKQNVEIKGEDECWFWKGKTVKNKDGFEYGYLYFLDKSMKAHRFSYWLFKGGLPKDKLVCHTCNKGLCVNPKHLYLGTHTSNMLDMAAAGTNKITKRRLTQQEVEEIRKLFKTQEVINSTEMAVRFNITQPYAWRLMHNERRPS